MTDEIKRLRNDYSILKRDYDALREEIAVLRTTEAGDNERLRAALDIAKRAVNVTQGLWQSSEKECAELRAEIERRCNDYSMLKQDYDALREDWTDLMDVASRTALDLKP